MISSYPMNVNFTITASSLPVSLLMFRDAIARISTPPLSPVPVASKIMSISARPTIQYQRSLMSILAFAIFYTNMVLAKYR